ncbi:hypothetical protein [Chromobacterium violaceum]|uniref:hypothetical protein n=1 Tax=Chromobacterium violaceum TaxID=536 RepID=UPI0012D33CEE|nr:hypothetical protein [Chromobacterium violaceum]
MKAFLYAVSISFIACVCIASIVTAAITVSLAVGLGCVEVIAPSKPLQQPATTISRGSAPRPLKNPQQICQYMFNQKMLAVIYN